MRHELEAIVNVSPADCSVAGCYCPMVLSRPLRMNHVLNVAGRRRLLADLPVQASSDRHRSFGNCGLAKILGRVKDEYDILYSPQAIRVTLAHVGRLILIGRWGVLAPGDVYIPPSIRGHWAGLICFQSVNSLWAGLN